jgi:mannosyl-oligosaccharide alpha-1,3-glucosidase
MLSSTRSVMLLLALAIGTSSFHLVMAVDRTKFRTCAQTSFCRRHRANKSAVLYNYNVVPGSVHFHLPSETAAAASVGQPKGDFWSKFKQGIYGTTTKSGGMQGPPPTLTGTLANVAAQTSTDRAEELQFTVHAMADGLVRLRVTEVATAGTAHETPRVTYDELVLQAGGMQAAKHAQWIPPGAPALAPFMTEGQKVADYMGLEFGDSSAENSRMLLVRMESFAVFLYRQDDIAAGPILSIGDQEMMHFEVRRFKDTAVEEAVADEKEEVKEGETKEADAKVEEKKEEKEIVGYWEDGLAIYADGTREEKEEVKEDLADHRKLSESDLDREGMWDEKFSSHPDTKPFGPMSVGMDISFPKSQHIFGLPEHASSTVLHSTQGDGAHYKEPFRLYNLDVFEYELDETMALYGAVPLIVSQSLVTGTSGVFWFNPSETYVDVITMGDGSQSTHWISESGILDIFLLSGPTPADLYRQYSHITGTMPLPPMFSLGYHQCRWNYKDEKDVYMVQEKFEELDYPYDVLWLDIEHTDGKRYFTWDNNLFPKPVEMQEKLWAQGRRMVTIIDPHIKRDDNYYIHKEATAKGLYIKEKDGNKDFDGWCWPGSSSYLDFTQEKVRSWWADQFSYKKYKGSSPSLFTWNDMNEMSVFNGPEVTMSKDTLNLNGEEHREWHNIYGMLFHQATGMGQIRRNEGEDIRPFVLSRAFFAGSQKYGAIWTGDNEAKWDHLVVSNPMLLSLNVGALSFVGADVGGFFGNPDAELMTRWMQAGAYQPFFRGHAHHDAKRREPWMFGEETMQRLRHSAMARYALLPFWYNTFREAGISGMPVMRTMWMLYPKTISLFATDDQYMIGSSLLVKPVTGAGVTETTVAFPTDDIWYDVDTMEVVGASPFAAHGVKLVTVESDINKIPVYQRGGSVIPRKLRLRRSAYLMKKDPYSIYIALDESKKASGGLYMDDEETFGHAKREEFAEATFAADFSGLSTIKNVVTTGAGWKQTVETMEMDRMIERFVVMGVEREPTAISAGKRALEFEYVADAKILVIHKPSLSALQEWVITIA